ncbi:MAG: molybdopterin biosynthesis protein [Methanomicrobiales archaeon]|nr:molybdopterin biosynthesis protein [Methanomicrobiales archaeon]
MVKRYLSLKSLREVHDLIRQEFPGRQVIETIPLERSVGRITAQPLFASYSVPEVHLSAMDGIAVRSEDTWGASEQSPVMLHDFFRVNTGNVVPAGYDAVIMIEDVRMTSDGAIIRKAVSSWQHVRPAGEDIAESEMILPSGHRIRPHDIGALAAYGIMEVPVLTVSIGIIPTGTELVPAGTRPLPGQVVESNTVMAAAWLNSLGATCRHYPPTPDEPEQIRDAIRRAVEENDMVIVSAGSSAGTRDFTAPVIAELGEVLVHGVGIKPGKPAIIGRIGSVPVIGMPGYPLSALTVLREIIIPLLFRFGLTAPDPEILSASLTATLHSEVGTCEFVLLSIGMIRNRWVAIPLSRGSGVQMSGVRANAFLHIPDDLEGYEAGQTVPVELLVPRSLAASALLVTGSHDPSLDHLAELVRKEGVSLHSSHTGSMGGLLALKRMSCHAAPMHLLSPDTGEYNIPYLEKYLPGEEISLVCIAEREQGIVSRERFSLADLPGHTFVNRQKGSGTRLLLDYKLRNLGISPGSIPGYDRELTTHIGVALAVKTGEADAGMCVYSAAKALGLPFVPVGTERYELAFRTGDSDDPKIRALVNAIASPAFRESLSRLGGYDTQETGVLRQVP